MISIVEGVCTVLILELPAVLTVRAEEGRFTPRLVSSAAACTEEAVCGMLLSLSLIAPRAGNKKQRDAISIPTKCAVVGRDTSIHGVQIIKL